MTQTEDQKRMERSKNLQVFRIHDQEYLVESASRKFSYKVMLNNGQSTCTCPDFESHFSENPQFKCKHILAVVNGNGNVHELNAPTHNQKIKKIDDRWITNIKGKDFILFQGLLSIGHTIGLQSISVETLQYPNKNNGNMAICKAVSITKNGEIYQDIGDATPNNVNKLVANHILRVASTRAIARTLRLMCNIGITALEEIDDISDDAETQKPKRNNSNAKSQPTRQQPAKQETKAKSQQPTGAKTKDSSAKETEEKRNDNSQREIGSNGKPSQSQFNAIRNLASRKSLSEEAIEKLSQDKLQTPFHDISSEQAGQLIKLIQSA